MDKQSEFLSFPTAYCGKPELKTIWSFSEQPSHEFFLYTDSNYYIPTGKLYILYILLLLIARKLTFEYDQMRVISKIPKNYKQKQ